MRSLAAVGLCVGVAVWSSCCGAKDVAPPAPTPGPMTPLPDTAFVVRWGLPGVPQTVAPNQRFAAAVIVENAGDQVWFDPKNADTSGSGAGAVRLSYRWWGKGASAPLGAYAAARGDLARPIPPGKTAVLAVEVTAPATAGEYRLQLDLCQEMVAWFDLKGADKSFTNVTVK
jgi:hypothetical protein